MRWPWAKKPEKRIPEGVTVLDVGGAQAIVIRYAAQDLPPSTAQGLRERLRSALSGTSLEGVPVVILTHGVDLCVLTTKGKVA